MTIGYLTSQYPAASHTFIRREIAALRSEGIDILTFSVRPGQIETGETVPSILGQAKSRIVLRVIRSLVLSPVRSLRTFVVSQQHRVPGLKEWVWSIFHFIEALVLADMLREAKVERLHSHFANSGATVGLLAAHFVGIPWSLMLHGISETDYPMGGLLADKIERADFVAAASSFMRAQGMRITSLQNWNKFTIVRCGVELPPKPPLPSGPVRNFCTVGRLSAEKGYFGLFKALASMKRRGLDPTLTIVGDGPLSRDISRQIAEFGLTDCVTLRGALPEQEALEEIGKADAFVLPSLMEGLPVVLMEAMAAGKPSIAACVAGIPELIEHGETGLLFEVSNWDDLERQMTAVMEQPDLCERLSANGRFKVEQEFAIERAVQPLLALFDQKKALSHAEQAQLAQIQS
ncbi:glycosyltransferase [Altererythrobacter aurantiacus]|uniref:Glycosyltransferase n=1 Tax=Parapontixanthobacter aurantiacus TaxID=1463599 RepID=A0A844ZGQ6_9SPHN|nr:glycosyltransferase [Parapontixanthobacter aurantiacus]MXO87035.1 glycosyltransferase [Parapontixanthobacter aurantiacus]